jgi:hypothetical protein
MLSTPGSAIVYKCGAPIDYGLPLKSDNVFDDELISWNIINFDNFINAWVTI